MTINSQDSSGYQGLIDWDAEKRYGIQVGIEKATEGTGYTNPYFAENWRRMKAAGMLRGAYHFGGGGDPLGEVDFFLRTVGPLEAGDTLWLDIEAHAGPGWGHAFMVELERRVGTANKIGVYTGRWYIDQTGGPGAWQPLTRWAYWFSAYQSNAPSAAQLAPWGTCVLWQCTSSARIPGVAGLVDASIIENGGFFAAHQPPAPAGQEDDMAPAVAVTSDGTQYYFWKGADGNLWQGIIGADGKKSEAIMLGFGPLGSSPTAGVDGKGATFAAWKGMDGDVWRAWIDSASKAWVAQPVASQWGPIG